MATFRMDRLNKEFLRLIAELISSSMKDDTAREAILTHVDCSRDLAHAKVYFTLLDESRLAEVTKALAGIKGALRGRLGKAMHIRRIPELHFVFDESEKRARAMDEFLDRVKEADRAKSEG